MWRRAYYKSTKDNVEDNLNYVKKDARKNFHYSLWPDFNHF
jgi:hypothetical protein